MRAAQIVVYVLSFAVVFILGNLFDFGLWQARIHADAILGGRPLPVFSQFLFSHHHVSSYLTLLPWLGFIGAPLLTFAGTKDYWDAPLFAMRCLIFLFVEALLFVALLVALGAPFMPYYKVIDMRGATLIEAAVRFGFWGVAGLVALASAWRVGQIRAGRESSAH